MLAFIEPFAEPFFPGFTDFLLAPMALMSVSRCPYDLWLLMPRALTPMLAPLVPTLMLTQHALTLRQRRQLPMLYSRRFSRVCHLCRF